MSIVAQRRRPAFTNLRIAIWSAFLLVVVAPLLFERLGRPYFAATLLRPGYWILARVNPGITSDRAIVLLNFVIYLFVIYAALRLLRRNRSRKDAGSRELTN
ncbi:MAG TPA: hypothetical protein VG498_20560 [Terriglobales bacterium]|nr:hypothetical protein [Terriglobales bacterium]